MKLAPTIGIAVDHRRRNRSLESLQVGLRPPQWHHALSKAPALELALAPRTAAGLRSWRHALWSNQQQAVCLNDGVCWLMLPVWA